MKLHEFYRGKKILVTGHTGFKGAWLAQILIHWGAKVTGYALKPNTKPNLFVVLDLESDLNHIIGDIRDLKKFNDVVKKAKPDIIFHLAAQPLVRDSYDDPIYTYEANIMGTANVLEAIRLNQIKAGVIITTDKVYKNFEKDYAFKEEDQLGGHDPYSNSKACADLVTDSYIKSYFNSADFGVKHKTLIASARSGNVIGGGDWAKDRLIPDAVRAFLGNNEDLIVRSPKAIRPWQHVFEPLYGYLLLGQHLFNEEIDKIGAWNFGPADADMQTVANVLRLFIAEIGKGQFRVEEDHQKHEAGNLKLDNQKAKKKLNWIPRFDLMTAIEETASWYKTFYSNPTSIKQISLESINRYFKD